MTEQETRQDGDPYVRCPRCTRLEHPDEMADGRCRICRESARADSTTRIGRAMVEATRASREGGRR
jgi:hypothetical protein